MIFLSVGLPGRFAEWCDAVIGRIASRLGGAVIIKTWPSLADMLGYDSASSALDELALTLIATSATHIVMGARQPDERLRLVLDETKARFVLALDDPRVAVADILGETEAGLRAVTRAVANSCPLVKRYSLLEGALTIPGQGTERDATAIVSAIARHFQIAIGRSDAGRIVDELAEIGLAYSGSSPDVWSARIPDVGKPMVDGALAAYAGAFSGSGIGRIVWTRDLFIVASDPGKSPTEVLDVSHVSGDDRFLIYGPYIQLPPGSWTARVLLGLSRDAAGYTFVVDAYAGKRLASSSFQPLHGESRAGDHVFDRPRQTGPGAETLGARWQRQREGSIGIWQGRSEPRGYKPSKRRRRIAG